MNFWHTGAWCNTRVELGLQKKKIQVKRTVKPQLQVFYPSIAPPIKPLILGYSTPETPNFNNLGVAFRVALKKWPSETNVTFIIMAASNRNSHLG
jgi:hypothetical protein